MDKFRGGVKEVKEMKMEKEGSVVDLARPFDNAATRKTVSKNERDKADEVCRSPIKPGIPSMRTF